MLIYISLIVFCFLLASFKLPRTIENMALIIIAVFMCFGYMTGTDWYLYESFYKSAELSSIAERNRESGYFIIQSFFSRIGVDFWIFHITVKLLVFYSLIYFVRSFKLNVFLFLALFIPEVGFYLFIDCPFRNLIAFGFALIAFRMLFNDKKLLFFLFTALAMSFHLSVVVLLIIFFFYKKDIKIVVVLGIAIFAYVLAFNIEFLIKKVYIPIAEMIPIVGERLQAYFLNSNYVATEINKGTYIRIFILLILLLFKSVILNGDKTRQYVYNLAILSMLLYPFGVTMKILHRFYLYLTPFYALSIIYLLNSFTIKVNRYIIYSFFIGFSLLQTYVLVIYDYRYVPYSNYIKYWIKKDFPSIDYRNEYNKKYTPYKRPSSGKK